MAQVRRNKRYQSSGRVGKLLAAPSGTLELWPDRARRHFHMRDSLLSTFMHAGYEPVVTPLFEYANLYEVSGEGRAAMLRFVEPDSGKVALFRPDITPQIVRMVSAHRAELGDSAPKLWRLCYEATVLRPQKGRGRPEREIRQAGIELLGVKALHADIEVADVMLKGLKALGLQDTLIELSHAGYWKTILEALAEPLRQPLMQAVAAKDAAVVKSVLKAQKSLAELVLVLVDCFGDFKTEKKAFELARRVLRKKGLGEFVEGPQGLCKFYEHLQARHPDIAMGFDLAQVDGFRYYNGLRLVVYAEGPGQPIASGGRYDGLLAAYDLDWAAVGCAFDLHNLERALRMKARA